MAPADSGGSRAFPSRRRRWSIGILAMNATALRILFAILALALVTSTHAKPGRGTVIPDTLSVLDAETSATVSLPVNAAGQFPDAVAYWIDRSDTSSPLKLVLAVYPGGYAAMTSQPQGGPPYVLGDAQPGTLPFDRLREHVKSLPDDGNFTLAVRTEGGWLVRRTAQNARSAAAVPMMLEGCVKDSFYPVGGLTIWLEHAPRAAE